MTVPIQDPIASYIANGVTAGPFTVPFRILVNDDLKVLSNGAISDPSTYVFSGLGDDEGSITFFTLPPAGTSIIVYRQVALERENDYQFNGDLRAVSVNADFDRIWMALQDIGDTASRAIHYPITEFGVDGTLPLAGERASTILGFDTLGNQTLLPITASVGAGDLRWELGSDGTPGFKAGVDFTPDVTTQLTLSRSPINAANTWAYWDATPQNDITVAADKLNFPTPIPSGISVVMVRTGTTLSLGLPAQQSVTNDSVADGANISADKLLYTPGWINGGPRIVTEKLDDRPDIRDIYIGGTVGTGHDDTAAMMRAHSAGIPIHYPVGQFIFTNITGSSGGIIGEGYGTRLVSTDLSASDIISFSADNSQPAATSLTFEKFALIGQSAKAAGAGFKISAPNTENQGMQMERVAVLNLPSCVEFGRASNWVIDRCLLINYKIAGVLVDNLNNPDSGDSTISACGIGSSVAGSPVGILQRASGGLRVINNKINGGAYGYLMQLTAPTDTSILLLDGNSIENQSVAAISLSRQSGAANFSKISIIGNEMNINPNGIITDTSGAFYEMAIAGNTIGLSSTTIGNCMSLTGVSGLAIGPNTLVGNGGTPNGIGIAASTVNGKIQPQIFNGIAGPQRIVNNSASVVYDEVSQRGVAGTVTTGTAFGSAFTGTIAVAFAEAFSVEPDNINCTVNGSGGSYSAFPVNITLAGFTLQVVGATNGGVVTGTKWSTVGGVI